MSNKYKIRNPEGMYFVTCTVYDWIDVFTRNEYRNVLVDSLNYCVQNKGLAIYAWCLMTNHLHLLATSFGSPLEAIIRDFKRHTSIELRKAITEHPVESRREWMVWMLQRAGSYNSNNTDWQFWQQDNHPVEMLTNEMLFQKLQYIHQNPVKAGFVAEPHEYVYSSAVDYAGRKGLLNIEVLL